MSFFFTSFAELTLPPSWGDQAITPGNESHKVSCIQIAKMAPLHYACILFLLATDFIGFDCGDHGFNITTLSLLGIGDWRKSESALKKASYNY